MRSSCALATLLLKLDTPSSLKDKRSIIRSAVDRLGARKNVRWPRPGKGIRTRRRNLRWRSSATLRPMWSGDGPDNFNIESDDAIEVFVTRLEVY